MPEIPMQTTGGARSLSGNNFPSKTEIRKRNTYSMERKIMHGNEDRLNKFETEVIYTK